MVQLVVFAALLAATPSTSAEEEAWLQQARQALAKGDHTGARTAASKVLSHNAGSVEAEVILGLADTAENQLSSAEKHFAKAAALRPGDYRVHTYLGSTYLREGRLAEANAAFSRVLRLNPGNTVAQYNLGVAAALQGKPAVAIQYFSAVHKSNPSDAAVLVALLECQLNLKQSAAARDSAQKLDKLLPSDSPALLQVGTALAARGEYETAVPLLRHYAAANPGSSDAGYNFGLALLHTGRLEEAETALSRLVRDMPAPGSYDLLGAVQEKRGEQKEALRSFAEASRLAPDNEEFRIDYGSLLVNASRLEEAVAAFSEGVARLPDSIRLRLGLGSALYLSGRYEEAANALLEGIRREPKSAPAYDLLGKIYESAPERQEQIFAAFQAYLRLEAQDAAVECHYGIMLYLRAEGEEPDRFLAAKRHLRRAVTLNPKLAEAHAQLGVISQAEGNWADAVAFYQRAVALAPNSATDRYRLGLAYQKLGQASKAQSELAAFRRLKDAEGARERESLMQGLGSSAGR